MTISALSSQIASDAVTSSFGNMLIEERARDEIVPANDKRRLTPRCLEIRFLLRIPFPRSVATDRSCHNKPMDGASGAPQASTNKQNVLE